MAPRTTARPMREIDFSNVGKTGRRTGVTLPQGRLDDNGMEEITGIFSSPRKPSPLKNSITILESVEEKNATPVRTQSARKSRPPRSISPRKSGISGTARRSNVVDVLGSKRSNREQPSEVDLDQDNAPTLTPSGHTHVVRNLSPSKTPSRDNLMAPARRSGTAQSNTATSDDTPAAPTVVSFADTDVDEENEDDGGHTGTSAAMDLVVPNDTIDGAEYMLPNMDADVEYVSMVGSQREEDGAVAPLLLEHDDEDVDQNFEPGRATNSQPRGPTIANSRRKRRSDAMNLDANVEAISSPAAKRAKRISNEEARNAKQKTATPEAAQRPSSKPQVKEKEKERAPVKTKDANTKLSTRREAELDNVVEKIKARPGQKKSLYILRRETPADDAVTHTRSGRISVRPLAYWRNEKCVFGGSPGGASLQDGARFPLNSIKEIIRTDEVAEKSTTRAKKGRKAPSKAKKQQNQPVLSEESSSDDDEDDEEQLNEDAAWETEIGTLRGSVSIWDPEQQAPLEENDEIDIAYAPAAIQTRDVKGGTFKYAKLLHTKLVGSGIVELPPGGVKTSKNSRRMHMTFFVATGRVTVQVGPIGGPESKFSIGKGGFWQVPRGNQYSLANEHAKTVRLFFNQACEPVARDGDE